MILQPFKFFTFVLCLIAVVGIAGRLRSQEKQNVPGDPPVPDRKVVLEQIDRLANGSFQVRETAEVDLWKMGPSIEPILIEKEQAVGLETRIRINKIRRKFAVGLTADMPQDVQALILSIIEEPNEAKRAAGIITLAKRGFVQPATTLIDRIPPQARSSAILEILNAISKQPRSDKLDALVLQLIKLAVTTPGREGVRTTQQIIASQYLSEHADMRWFGPLFETLSQCLPENKYSVFSNLPFRQTVSKRLSTQEFLPLWIDLVAFESNRMRRIGLLNQHTSPTNFSLHAMRLSHGNLDKPLDAAKMLKVLDATGKFALLDYVLGSPTSIDILFNDADPETLLKICASVDVSYDSSYTIGRLTAIKSWPQEKHDILSLIERENDAKKEVQLIRGYLVSLGSRSRFTNELPMLQIDAIWKKLTVGEPQRWHLAALLGTYDAPRAFGKKQTQASCQRMLELAKDADAVDASAFAYASLRHKLLAEQLSKYEMLFDVLKLVRDHPGSDSIITVLTSMFRSGHFADQFRSPELRKSLIDFCLAEKSRPCGYYIMRGVVANQQLLPRLLEEDHFETIFEKLIVGRDGTKNDATYATLLSEFLSSRAVIDHLVRGNRVDLILALDAQGVPQALINQILGKIVNSDVAVSAILENGHWDHLNEAVDAIDDDTMRAKAHRSLRIRKAFAVQLSDQGQVVATLNRLANDDDWMRQDLYNTLIKNLPAEVATREPSVAKEFWDFASKLDRSDRAACVSSLLSSGWYVNALAQQGTWQEMIQPIRAAVGGSRVASVIKGIATQQRAVEQISSGQLSSLLSLSDLLEDDVAQTNFHRQLGDSYFVGKWLQEENQPDQLIDALQSVTDQSHRAKFAFACFSGRSFAGVNEHKAYTEKLVRFIAEQPKSTATLMTLGLLSQEKMGPHVASQDLANCLRTDIADAVEIAMKDVAWRRARKSWANLVKNLPASAARQQPELAWKMWSLISEDKKNPSSETINQLFKTAWFVPQMTKLGKIPEFMAGLKQSFRAWDLRTFATQYAQGPGIIQELERGSIDVLLGLCDLMEPGDADNVPRFIGGYPNIQAWFATSKQPEKLFRVFDSIKDQKRRERFAYAFLRSGILGQQKGNDTLVPQVVTYSRKHSDDFQVKLAVVLLGQYATDDAASKTDLPTFIIDRLALKTVDVDLLAATIRTPNLNELIFEKKLQRKIIQDVMEADQEIRLTCFHSLLSSKAWQAHLTDEDLAKMFSLTQQQGEQQLAKLIRSQPFFVQRMIELGKYDIVQRIATMRSQSGDHKEEQWDFYVNAAVVRQQRAEKRRPGLLVDMLGSRQPGAAQLRLTDLGQHPEAARWIIESYGWKPFADAIESIPSQQRMTVVSRMFSQKNLFAELAKAEGFAELIQEGDLRDFMVSEGGYVYLLRSREIQRLVEPNQLMELIHQGYEQSDPRLHRSAYLSLSNTALWEVAVETGHGKWLLSVLNQPTSSDSPKQARERRRDNVTGRRGLLWLAIRAGEFDAAEKMLSEFTDDDLGRLRMIRFQMHRRLVQQAAGENVSLSHEFTALLAKDQRLEAYWARSQQDNVLAIALAKETGDAGLVWNLTLESHDWAALRDLPVCKTKELPFPPVKVEINPVHRRIEQLGFLTLLRQASGQKQVSTEPLQTWIANNVTTPNTPRYAGDALVSVGEIDAAKKLLDERLGRRAFYWHTFRLDFDAAMKSQQWSATTPQAFFEKLSGKSIGNESPRMQAAGTLIHIAKAMRESGQTASIEKIMPVLRAHAGHEKLTQMSKNEYIRNVANLLHTHDFTRESRQMIVLSEDANTLGGYFYHAYSDPKLPGAAAEASVWLGEFESRYPSETRLQRLARVDAAMTAATPLDELRPFPDFDGKATASAVPVTRYRYQLYDQVFGIIAAVEPAQRTGLILLGQTHLEQENYREAAEAFFAAFQESYLDLTRLYLAGHCWEKAGDHEKAIELKLLARSLAIDHERNWGLAIGIAKVGLQQEALEVYRTLLLNSPPSSTTYIQSLLEVATHETNTKREVDRWTEFVLYHMRPIRYYYDLNVWLQCEINRRAALAKLAIQQGRFEDAKQQWQLIFKISPADVSTAKKLSELLRKKGQDAFATEVLDAQREYLKARQAEFADSPEIKERAALQRSAS